MPQMTRTVLFTLTLLLSTGCMRRVTILSDPSGAMVHKGRKRLGPTPLELTLWPVPFLRQPVRVGMSGYRGEWIYIGRNLGLWRRQTTHEIILVKTHGPSGTWAPEDAGRR